MRDTATMVNGFDMSSVDALDPELRTIVERRASLLGPAYRLFYRNPVRIVRGEGVHLYDADGQAYLDAYNNVPSVGHCHPRVVEAIARQAATLNTHTRYASELILDYAERLLGTFPAGIGNVMFTCTGSEAVDLALRIARFRTGGDGVVITANAYHGVTAAAAEISPSLGPAVPLGRAVWTVAAPGPGDTLQSLATRVRAAIADMGRHGVRLAAFIADTLFSSDGIQPEPAGFLRPVADAVRAAGGLFIADEVQPGFGRTGEAMWGFQRHGVEPDLAVMGKPMGNGMPIAGVAARPEILAEFGNKIRYFNTFGGNSVCVAAAAAVLDVIETEGLRENARAVGGYLRGVEPDLAVMGKPMGNGMPIAGVAARPEILAEFGNKIRYFNTFGGNSVCVAAAAAVLDVIETEGLRENARAVGGYLRGVLEGIGKDEPRIGAVRTCGLYAAADFVRPEDGAPDGDTALRVVNGLRERRVLISATGPDGSSLKIRPPLPFSQPNVDQLAEALTDTLRTL